MRNVVIPTLSQTFGSWLQIRRIGDLLTLNGGVCGGQGGVPIPSDMNDKFEEF